MMGLCAEKIDSDPLILGRMTGGGAIRVHVDEVSRENASGRLITVSQLAQTSPRCCFMSWPAVFNVGPTHKTPLGQRLIFAGILPGEANMQYLLRVLQ